MAIEFIISTLSASLTTPRMYQVLQVYSALHIPRTREIVQVHPINLRTALKTVFVLASLGSCLVISCVYLMTRKFYTVYQYRCVRDYIERDFLPVERQVNGQWPKDLNGLVNLVKSDIKDTNSPAIKERLQMILDLYQTKPLEFHIEPRSVNECKYTLSFDGFHENRSVIFNPEKWKEESTLGRQ